VKLKVFFASDGDCLLLTSGDGHHALIDGGRSGSFQKQAWPTLHALAKADEVIDLVVVSHIDADHISGILWLMKVVAAWSLYDYQTTDGGNPGFPEPAMPRPPTIKRLWHNSWRAQLGDLAAPIEEYVSRIGDGLQTASFDRSKAPDAAVEAIDALQGLAESIPDGVDLLRIVDNETPVPRNEPFKDLVLLRDPPHVEKLGKTTLTVIGPAKKHLERLREEWRDWLTSAGQGTAPPRPPDARGPGLALGGIDFAEERAEAEQLVASLVEATRIIADTDPSKVTPPNRASITLLAEESKRTCLLTGDAAEEEILEGLDAAGRIVNGQFRCNVVKVQHHGSEHNVSQEFARTVFADHYVFCADGAHEHPDPSVVKTIAETRSAEDQQRPFTLWFNSSPARTLQSRRKALRDAIDEARAAAGRHPGITVNVLDRAKPFLEIPV
jgi:beta-lactamase superfamily II metal-dependent hydrolase